MSEEKLSIIKTPIVFQRDRYECGAASLSIILRYYGCYVPLDELRVLCEVSDKGSTAKNILKAARRYGLDCKGFAKPIEKLLEIELPVIVFWRSKHYLVLERFSNEFVYLSDPARGRYRLRYEKFEKYYSGIVLVFKPNDSFIKSSRKKVKFDFLSFKKLISYILSIRSQH